MKQAFSARTMVLQRQMIKRLGLRSLREQTSIFPVITLKSKIHWKMVPPGRTQNLQQQLITLAKV
jgi:hypothetical protein